MNTCGLGHFVGKHPFCVFNLVLIVVAICLTVTAFVAKFPDFSDPQLGFETRGTEISRRLTTWANLIKATQPGGPLEVNPEERKASTKVQKRAEDNSTETAHVVFTQHKHSSVDGATERLAEALNEELNPSQEEDSEEVHDHDHLSEDGFFCDSISHDYSHLVVRSEPGVNLLTAEALKAQCSMQDSLMTLPEAGKLCQRSRPKTCCPVWSLANYVVMINNRTQCSEITDEDIWRVLNLLENCSDVKFDRYPADCWNVDAAEALLVYLLPLDRKLWNSTTMMYLPIAYSAAVLPFYRSIPQGVLKNELVTSPASDFGVSGALFDEYLFLGIILMALSFIFIIVCLWCYTGSVFMTFGAIAAMMMALLFAYFIYTVIFGINFFPFINLLAIVIAIGIGADDAFIYVSVWKAVQQDERSVGEALRAAAPSMCVTSLTTAAALFANCVSPITAINCFSVFAGTAVLVNLALMLTWLPACVVIADTTADDRCRPMSKCSLPLTELIPQASQSVQENLLNGVLSLRRIWVFIFGLIAIGAAVVVLYYPKLRLPDTTNIHLFDSSHPFEVFENHYKKLFQFENEQTDVENRMLLHFVWGVIPEDNGNHLDPESRGRLVFNPDFDIASQESQKWLLNFCGEIRRQPWYQPTFGSHVGHSCFIEAFKNWMQRRCKDISGNNVSPCCERSSFPFSHRVFHRCITKMMASLHATPHAIYARGAAGPKFARGKSDIKAVVVEFDSNYTFSTSMPGMSEFYERVETWFRNQTASAPVGMRGGWFVSDLGFWDLQVALSNGTQSAIIFSLGVALIVVFLTTLNTLLSLFTVLTIAAIIFTTVAILVLLGWRLNVLESIAVTTAIGLAVDLPLHYAVHYRLGAKERRNRDDAVSYAVMRMAGPTAMAALTTAAAGGFMLMSSALPYIQVGILLVVLTFISWVFASLFLMPLLAVAGPVGSCGQMSRPRPSKWCRGPPDDKPIVHALASEITASTSCGPAEIHELQSLNDEQDEI